MLSRRESILMVACVEEDRVRQMTRDPKIPNAIVTDLTLVRFCFRLNSFTGSPSRVHRTSVPDIFAFLLRHARLLQNSPELVRHSFMSEGLVVVSQ